MAILKCAAIMFSAVAVYVFVGFGWDAKQRLLYEYIEVVAVGESEMIYPAAIFDTREELSDYLAKTNAGFVVDAQVVEGKVKVVEVWSYMARVSGSRNGWVHAPAVKPNSKTRIK